jgi:hypothetical protein
VTNYLTITRPTQSNRNKNHQPSSSSKLNNQIVIDTQYAVGLLMNHSLETKCNSNKDILKGNLTLHSLAPEAVRTEVQLPRGEISFLLLSTTHVVQKYRKIN